MNHLYIGDNLGVLRCAQTQEAGMVQAVDEGRRTKDLAKLRDRSEVAHLDWLS